jgi:hypothetical protein
MSLMVLTGTNLFTAVKNKFFQSDQYWTISSEKAFSNGTNYHNMHMSYKYIDIKQEDIKLRIKSFRRVVY